MTEYTANLELAATNKEHRANPAQVALVARNRAARAKRRALRTAVLVATILALSTTILEILK